MEEKIRTANSYYLIMLAGAGPVVASFARMGAGGRPFSVRTWFGGDDPIRSVIIRQSQRTPKLSAMMVRLLLKAVADAAAERAGDRAPPPTWLYLDEVPQLGKLDALTRLAAIGRPASIRLVACVQSTSQLREIYTPDGARALLDNFATKIVARVAAGETAKEIAEKWIGAQLVSWWEPVGRDERGREKSEKRTKEVLVVDPEFLEQELGVVKAFGRAVARALVLGHGDVALLKWPVGLWPALREAFLPVRRRRVRNRR